VIFQQLVPCNVARIHTGQRVIHQQARIEVRNPGSLGERPVALAEIVAPLGKRRAIFLLLD